jgi:beta-galactosidase
VLATFGDDFYAGSPAVCRNRFGAGSAYYIATDPDDEFLAAFLGSLLDQHGIGAALDAPPGVEVAVRERDGRRILFVLNHTADVAHIELDATYRDLLRDMRVVGTLAVAPRDVRILVPAE